MTHDGDFCSFDAFLKEVRPHRPRLAGTGCDRAGLDTSRLNLAPQSAGLYALSLGLSKTFNDDHEMLMHGMVMYDALYAWCQSCQAETTTGPRAWRHEAKQSRAAPAASQGVVCAFPVRSTITPSFARRPQKAN